MLTCANSVFILTKKPPCVRKAFSYVVYTQAIILPLGEGLLNTLCCVQCCFHFRGAKVISKKN
jgi:hypothetical protein